MQNIKKILKDGRTYYVIALLGILIYPPINEVWYGKNVEFIGWYFITEFDWGDGGLEINVPYIAIEFFVVSVIYFIYRKK